MPGRKVTPEYKRNRAEILKGDPVCHWCKKALATEADHLVPYDVEPDDSLTNLVPACKPCNSKRGAMYVNRKRQAQTQRRNTATTQSERTRELFFVDTSITPSPSHLVSGRTQKVVAGSEPVRSAVKGLGRVEPRLVTPVVGSKSFGGEVAEFARIFQGRELMAWQRIALDGQLTVDDAGNFVHREALISTARQNGKSVALTALIGWALTKWPVHRGEPVHVLSVANKLDRAVAIFLELADLLESMGAKVTRAYGRNKVVMPDGSTWEVRAAVPGLHGMSPTLIVVDELWNISEDVFFDALRPSQIAQRSPLMSCWSTAGDEGSRAMLRLREQALNSIDQGKPSKLFFAEWSMPSGVADPMEHLAWANPALGTTITMDALEAAAQTPDRGAFLRAHCNLWVSAADSWLPPGKWEACKKNPVSEPGGWLVVESSVDESRYLGVRCRVVDGKVHAQMQFVVEGSTQCWEAVETAMADPQLQLAVAATLDLHCPEKWAKRKTVWGYGEIQKWTGLSRSMILEGHVIHSGEELLAEHVNRAVLARVQGNVVLSSQKSPGPIEAARCLVVAVALTGKPQVKARPAIGSSRNR